MTITFTTDIFKGSISKRYSRLIYLEIAETHVYNNTNILRKFTVVPMT